MRIVKNKLPFPHVIIHDFYTDSELFHIWKELDFLSYKHKLLPPDKSGAACDAFGKPLKQNYAYMLDEIYKDRNTSNILTYNRKLFDGDISKEISDWDFSFRTWNTINKDLTLLSYYENSGHYKSHADAFCYTCLTWLYNQPKSFSGGNMYFEEYDYSLEIDNNMAILFHGPVLHKVTDVIMDSQYDVDSMNHFSCNGRYTITQFGYHAPLY